MATFLVTPRMSPALAARVERAVSRRRRAQENAAALGLARPFASGRKFELKRIWPVLAVALIGALSVAGYARDRRALEAERRSLLDALNERRAGVPAGRHGFVAEAERWIAVAAAPGDAGDLVDAALRAPGALDAWLARPAVYVRGGAADLRDARKAEEVARSSDKDAFLLCLMRPPPSTSEKDLLAKVRGVYFEGAKVDAETANVRRMAEARRGLAALGPAFEASVRAAVDHLNLRVLRRDLEGAPVAEAQRAAGAALLVVVADGPGREAAVTMIDVAAQKVLLRMRRPLAETGTSAAASLHREDMASCALAVALRARAVE